MDVITYGLTVLVVAGLMILTGYLCLKKETSSVSKLLVVACFALLLLHMAKFKHVKGWGIEAETWDEKQTEASRLIDALSGASETLSKEVILLTSRTGFLDFGFSNPELFEILEQTSSRLENEGVPSSRRDEILKPLKNRIILNYWQTATRLLSDEYVAQYQAKNIDHETAKAIEAEQEGIVGTAPRLVLDKGSLEPALSVIRSSKLFHPSEELLKNLTDINDDMIYFTNQGELRRKIDLDNFYRSHP